MRFLSPILSLTGSLCVFTAHASDVAPFQGEISAIVIQAGETNSIRYTVTTNLLRVERTETNWPHPSKIVDLQSGESIILLPHNRSFMRFNRDSRSTHQTSPSVIPQKEPLELKTNGQATNILGYSCKRYELKGLGEVMEIWATDRLPSFQSWTPNQLSRSRPGLIDEEWPELLSGRGLFPFLAVLRFENGKERLRFEVKSVASKFNANKKLFQTPTDYVEIKPPSF